MTDLQFIGTDEAPVAIGPYSQAVVSGGWIFVSGQIALDPGSGILEEGDAARQVDRALRNLAAILRAAGGSMASVVKTTVYLADMASFQAVNAVYADHFGEHRPARATVEASRLPAGAAVEVDAVARVVS